MTVYNAALCYSFNWSRVFKHYVSSYRFILYSESFLFDFYAYHTQLCLLYNSHERAKHSVFSCPLVELLIFHSLVLGTFSALKLLSHFPWNDTLVLLETKKFSLKSVPRIARKLEEVFIQFQKSFIQLRYYNSSKYDLLSVKYNLFNHLINVLDFNYFIPTATSCSQ